MPYTEIPAEFCAKIRNRTGGISYCVIFWVQLLPISSHIESLSLSLSVCLSLKLLLGMQNAFKIFLLRNGNTETCWNRTDCDNTELNCN